MVTINDLASYPVSLVESLVPADCVCARFFQQILEFIFCQ